MNNFFLIVVDYSKSLTEMIGAGNYDFVDSNINNEHFSIKNQGQDEHNIELIHYVDFMESDEIIRDLDSCGLRPATLPELLAFGASYPEKQKSFPIVALGSVWESPFCRRLVPCLLSSNSERVLHLSYWHGTWHDDYRFAAVRK